jgi:signal transduction histidine kinase
VLAVTTAGAAVLGWFAAGRVLRPLREITSTAQTISAGNLNERLALKGPNDEFKRLGDTLDDLLARLEGSFESQRRFVANASHELRTPLTLERTLLQVALADPNANEQTLRATCQELLISQAEQERLLEALLTLTSSERGLDRREPVDLAAEAQAAIRQVDARAEGHELALEATLAPATTAGDAALIRRLIANLIDNAVDHNIDGGRVEIRTEAANGYALVAVANSGLKIPADQVDRLFEPFQRLDGTRSADDGHHGLGLSIVRAIAVAHNAELTAAAQAGGGLSVTVRFPRRTES